MPDNTAPALREFLLQRYDDLKQRLTRHLGSDDMASEALHDAWIRLEGRENIVGVQNVGAYLMRMAVNIALDRLSSNWRLMSADDIDTLMDLPDPAPGPEQTAEARAEWEALLVLIQKMPLRRRQVLLLIRSEGLTQPEAAKRLGVSERTVSKELKAAHEYLASRAGRP
jgi:RNA polymerase sigma factor (sigma-70 family)